MSSEGLAPSDAAAVEHQLGRPPRDVVKVAHRCLCGSPDVVTTAPRLSDGTPFPTLYYLTCPRAVAEVSTLEASGLMVDLTARIGSDPGLASRYRSAHLAYVAERRRLADVPEIASMSAGGMPDRVKCLHALVAHALAAGPGVNPIGDEVLARLPRWWLPRTCVAAAPAVRR